MDLEKLIEAVRKYECLYDLCHRKYMDTKYKNIIWEKVGAEVGSSGATCKTRWANIRDTYRKSLKKSTTTSGQSAKKIKVYKFHDQLQFLKPFLNERPTIENIESDISEECDNELLGNQESAEIMEPRATTSMSTSLPSPESSQSASSVYLRPPKKARRTFSKSCSQPTAAAVVMEQLIKSNNTTEDPVDAFLLGAIAPILKSLPRYELALAKSELFGIAQKYEFQSITVPTVCTSADSRSSTISATIFENAPFTKAAIENPQTEDQEFTSNAALNNELSRNTNSSTSVNTTLTDAAVEHPRTEDQESTSNAAINIDLSRNTNLTTIGADICENNLYTDAPVERTTEFNTQNQNILNFYNNFTQ